MEIIAFIYLIQRDKALKATTHLQLPQNIWFVLNFKNFDFTPLQAKIDYVIHKQIN